MASVSNFKYTSINSSLGDIRVLGIYPGDQADDLKLSLDVVRITDDSELDFEAISYRWGSPDGKHPALLDGLPFILTSSQDRMIRDLRHTQNIRRVWIDALCINQKDIFERNDQVQLMRKVYGYARLVAIYLNCEVDEDSAAYRKLLTFSSECKPEDLCIEDESFWRQIFGALESEYFRRVWVQQEMSLARKLAVQCRRTPMPLKCLLHFLNSGRQITARRFKSNAESGFRGTIPALVFFSSERFVSALRKADKPFSETPRDFLKLLAGSAYLQCTDERDRIYGLMFLAHDWQAGYIITNYSLSVSDVFRDAMVSYMRHYGSISFLQHAYYLYENNKNIMDKTPSWVPEWRKERLSVDTLKQIPGMGSIERSLVAHISGNILYTEGIKITKVELCYGNFFGEDIRSTLSLNELWTGFNDIVENATHPSSKAARARRLWWLLGDIRPLSETDWADEHDTVALEHLFYSNRFNCCSMEKFRDLLDFRSSKTNVLMFTLLNGLFLSQLHFQRPFIDETGSIGLAPLYTQPGDELWLIPTCKYPVVLRPQNGKHIVLGAAWFDKEEIWEQVGGKCDCMTAGEQFGNYKAEPLCLE
jgi:hypothetical protein